MMKNLFITIFALSALVFTGCATHDEKRITYKRAVVQGFNAHSNRAVFINYHVFADRAIKHIFKDGNAPSKIMVTDFVDVTSLDNHTKLGYVLSNNIKNALTNNYQTSVIEAEVSKYFKISGNGLKILSRDLEKLRETNFNVKYTIVGTYTESRSELIVFVKLIDLETGIIKGSYAQTFPMGEGTRYLLDTK